MHNLETSDWRDLAPIDTRNSLLYNPHQKVIYLSFCQSHQRICSWLLSPTASCCQFCRFACHRQHRPRPLLSPHPPTSTQDQHIPIGDFDVQGDPNHGQSATHPQAAVGKTRTDHPRPQQPGRAGAHGMQDHRRTRRQQRVIDEQRLYRDPVPSARLCDVRGFAM